MIIQVRYGTGERLIAEDASQKSIKIAYLSLFPLFNPKGSDGLPFSTLSKNFPKMKILTDAVSASIQYCLHHWCS